MNDRSQDLRLLEAVLFASAEPLGPAQLANHLPEDTDLNELITDLQSRYANRGVNLVKVGNRWAFRTAADLAPMMKIETSAVRKLSRAATEALAIIAYHQPVTRAEIEEIRGVALSRGTLDTLLEAGWIRPKGRRRTPGRPVTWGTNENFLDHFGLESLDALPGIEELKAAGLLDSRPAITALSGRGHLLDLDEATEDTGELDVLDTEEDDEDVLEDGADNILAGDFGDDVVPDDPLGSDDSAAPDDPVTSDDPGAEAKVAGGDGEA